MNKIPHCMAGAGILLLLAASLLPGCSTAGVKFNTENVNKIVKGTTTKNDVRAYFGNPFRTEEALSGGEVWTYTYVDSHTTAAGALGHVVVGIEESETHLNKLSILFDGERVKEFYFDNGTRKDTYLPFR